MAINDVSDQYYTYQGRLQSFESAQPLSKRRASNVSSKAPKSIKWPHSFLTAEEMAKAGFFHYPTQENPDNTVCFLCQKSLDGWEEDDDPLAEHLKHSPNCGWAIVAAIDAQESELCLEYPLSSRMIEARKATFGNRWPHEGKKGWKCKIKQMVDAGWKYTPTPESDDLATCAYCNLALDGWEPSDRPLDEHHSRSPICAFFTLVSERQQNNAPKKAAKTRKPRASKASRLSTQSTFTTASETPSIADPPADEDDSVLTTDTTATVSSQTGRKMAKGKKGGKGRKTKTKKDEIVQISVTPEPEDDDFEVKVEQTKAMRGKKRASEATDDASTLIDFQPPAKRRGTRTTRGSVAIGDDLLSSSIIEKDVDITMKPADDIVTEKTQASRKKGRPSAAKPQRNVSSASTASKASLRMHMPDDDEIDRALQADLERPLTDEEDNGITADVPKTRRGSRLEKLAAPASVASVRKATGASKITNAIRDMFATGDVSVDEVAIEAELQAMEIEESKPLPKAKSAKGKQPRKPSAKQQAAAKRAAAAAEAAQAAADLDAVGPAPDQHHIPKPEDDHPGGHSLPQPRKGRKAGSVASSRTMPVRGTRGSVVLVNESNLSAMSGIDDLNDSGNESDASVASQSTVIRGGAERRGNSLKKSKGGKKAPSQNIEEIIHQSVNLSSDQQDSGEESQKKKPVGRPKKAVHAEVKVTEEVSYAMPSVSQEPSGQRPAAKTTKAKSTKVKGKAKAQPDLPVEAGIEPTQADAGPAPESPKRVPKELTPSISPQSSDAENRPPSSKPSTIKPAVRQSQISRIPLATNTPAASPSKRNVVAGLQSVHPWTIVDLDEVFLKSPSDARSEKENAVTNLLVEAAGKVKKGELTSPEKKMTVEEWILFNASLAEERLRGECERMVGIFEREGGRAMRVLESVECVD